MNRQVLKNNSKKCSFTSICFSKRVDCDNNQQKICKIAKDISFAKTAPCPVMQKLKESGEIDNIDIACDVEAIRIAAPFGKCSYQGECIRAFIPEVNEICQIRRKTSQLSFDEFITLKATVNSFYANLTA